MKKLDIQYNLKPNGAVIRINNYSGCIFRICRIPKELVFDENGNVREFIDLAYPQPEIIKQSKIPDQDKWTYPETENSKVEKPVVNEVFTDNGEHSHWNLIDAETGENLWSEFPEEDLARGFPVNNDEKLKINDTSIEKKLGRKYYKDSIEQIVWEDDD
jgi:hypothetical protein